MNLSGKRVKLRAIEISDLQFLKDMINDPRIEEMVVGWSFPISDHEQKEWIMKQMNDEKNIRLIVENEYEEKIGLISLTNIDWKNRSAVHGIKISNKNFKNQGYGAEAVKTIVNYGFNE